MGPPSLLLLLFLGATVAPAAPPDLEEPEDYAECSDGYEWDPETEHCKDVDECAGPPPCRPSQDCINLPGGFECRCPPGYRHRPPECVDEDECQFRWCQHSCANSPGAFACRCHAGFSLGPDGRSCLDVDECSMGARCSQLCLNTFGSFRCRCRPGFVLGADGHRCHDVDECRGGVPCQHRCQNLPGGFSCLCPPGYAQEGGLCRDRDECAEGSHECGGAQSCLNTFGGHLCVPRELCRGPYAPHPRSNGTCVCPRGGPGCAPRPRWLLHRFLALPHIPDVPAGIFQLQHPPGDPQRLRLRGGPPGTFRLRALTNHSSLLELVRPLAGPRQLLLEVELLRPGPRPPAQATPPRAEATPPRAEAPPPGAEAPPPGAWDPPPAGRGLALLRLHLSMGAHPF